MTIAGHHNPGAAAERPARNRNPLAGVLPGDPLTAREADLLAALGRAQSVTDAARAVGVTRPWPLVAGLPLSHPEIKAMLTLGTFNPGTVIEYDGARQIVRGDAGARQELESVK